MDKIIKVALPDFALEHGQNNAAKALGVTQGAICRAIKSGRNIQVTIENGVVKAEELRPFPNQSRDLL